MIGVFVFLFEIIEALQVEVNEGVEDEDGEDDAFDYNFFGVVFVVEDD